MVHILLADISGRGAAELVRPLQQRGHHVQLATDCNRAICMIRHGHHDLIVLDMSTLSGCGIPLLSCIQSLVRDPNGARGVVFTPQVDDAPSGDARELWGLSVINNATDADHACQRVEACAEAPAVLASISGENRQAQPHRRIA